MANKKEKILSLSTAMLLSVSTLTQPVMAADSNVESDEAPSITIEATTPDSFADNKFGDASWNITIADADFLKNLIIKSGNETLMNKEYTENINSDAIVYKMSKDDYMRSKKVGEGIELVIEAEDKNGNKISQTYTYKVDLAAEAPEIEGEIDKVIFNRIIDLKINNIDANKKNLKVEGYEGENLIFTKESEESICLSDSDFPEGNHEFLMKMIVTDNAGNEETFTKKIIRDTLKSEISRFEITGQKAGDWFNKDVNANIAINDNYGNFTYKLIDVYADKTLKEGVSSEKNIKFSLPFKELTEGDQELKLIVIDKAGNISEKNISFKADTNIPVIESFDIKEGVYQSLPNFKVIINDHQEGSKKDNGTMDEEGAYIKAEVFSGSEITKEVIKKQVTNATFTADELGITEDEEYKIAITAMDAAGNKAIERKTVKIDKTAPIIDEIVLKGDLSEYGWYNSQVEVSTNIIDNDLLKAYKLLLNGKELLHKDSNKSKETVSHIITEQDLEKVNNDGSFEFKIIAEDNAGNVSEKSISFKADTNAPVIDTFDIKEGVYQSLPDIKVIVNDKENGSMEKEGAYIKAEIYKGSEKIKEIIKKKVTNTTFTADELYIAKDGEYKIVITAMDAAENKAIEEKIIRIDKTAPNIKEISLKGDLSEYGWYSSQIGVNTSIDDNEEIKEYAIYLNDEELLTVNSDKGEEIINYTITEKDLERLSHNGNFTLDIVAKDKVGNTSEKSISFKADFKDPDVLINGPKENSYNQNIEDIVISTDEVHFAEKGSFINVKITKDEKIKEFSKESIKTVTLSKNDFKENGEYIISAWAVDAAGNKSTVKELSFIVDSEKPVIEGASLNGTISENKWYSSDILLTATLKDNIKLYNKEIMLNGKTLVKDEIDLMENKINLKITKEEMMKLDKNGEFKLDIKVSDKAGNQNEETIQFYADFTAPEISLKGPEENSFNQSIEDILISVDDTHYDKKGSYIIAEIIKDGNKQTVKKESSKSLVLNKSMFKDSANYKVTTWAIDAAGNKSEIKDVSFVIDNKAPEVKDILMDGHLSKKNWYNSAIKMSFTAKDNMKNIKSVVAEVNGKEYINKKYSLKDMPDNADFSFTVTKDDIHKIVNANGTLDFNITVIDAAENVKKYKKTVKVDIISPKLTLEGIEKGKHYNTLPTLKIINEEAFFEDGFVEVEILRDKKRVSIKKYNGKDEITLKNSTFKKDGDYVVKVNATDGADNKAKMVQTNFVIDKTKPELKVSGVVKNAYLNKAAQVTFAVNERYYKTTNVEILIERTLDGKKSESTHKFKLNKSKDTMVMNLSKTGTYKVYMIATDEAGNRATSNQLTFTVDTIKPVINSKYPNGILGYNQTVSPQVSVEDSYIDNISVEVFRNGQKVNMPFSKSANSISFSNFKKIKENDGRYEIKITATDKSGNVSTSSGSFIVNRFGSKYKQSDIKKGYYSSLSEDINITATNPSKLIRSDLVVKLDGESLDVGNINTAGSLGNYKTTFTISDKDVKKEGFYRIYAITEDEKGNVVNSADEIGELEFAIDRTKPSIITDLESETYKEESKTVDVSIKDNMALESAEVLVNGNIVYQSAKEDIKNNSTDFSFTLKEGEDQVVEIKTKDAAGNEEIVTHEVTVSDGIFKFNKGILALLGVAGVMVIAFILYLFNKKK